ncbi:MAG: thermonuclease family protein [Alphaproteobacteria bacterium]|nr:thermonuclease family protein [Alphaproteobacteria bacterium]
MNPGETSRLTVFMMRVLVFAALALALFGIVWLNLKESPQSTERTGQASVISDDTVAIPDTRPIRLRGIVAPRDDKYLRQPGGPESTANLRAFVEGKTIKCEVGQADATAPTTYGLCYLGGRDIGLYQIETGHARDCFDLNMDDTYARAETQARAQGKDLSAIFPLPDGCKR